MLSEQSEVIFSPTSERGRTHLANKKLNSLAYYSTTCARRDGMWAFVVGLCIVNREEIASPRVEPGKYMPRRIR